MQKVMPAILLALTVILAGCFGGGDDKEDPTGTVVDRGDPNAGNNGTGDGTAVLADLAVGPTNGTLPLDVTFLLNATLPGGSANATPDSWNWLLEAWVIPDGANLSLADATEAGWTDAGSGLPAVSVVTLDEGDYLARLTVSYPEYDDGVSERLFSVVRDGPPPATAPETPIFLEDAENGTDQWTVETWIEDNTAEPVSEPAPDGYPYHWAITADPRGDDNAWYSEYPDAYRTRMTSIPVVVPDDRWTYTLYYSFTGEAEDNGRDGVHVLVGPDGGEMQQVGYHTNANPEWVADSVSLEGFNGQTIRVAFEFTADGGCSKATPGAPTLCGEGAGDDFMYEGMWVDDIRIQ